MPPTFTLISLFTHQLYLLLFRTLESNWLIGPFYTTHQLQHSTDSITNELPNFLYMVSFIILVKARHKRRCGPERDQSKPYLENSWPKGRYGDSLQRKRRARRGMGISWLWACLS